MHESNCMHASEELTYVIQLINAVVRNPQPTLVHTMCSYPMSLYTSFPRTAVPDSPPLNFRILNIGVHSMDLTWSPPMAIHRNGPLVEYIVTYGIEGDNVETTQKLKANEMNIEESEVVVHTIERLTPYTRYFFVVAFANPAGRSDFTDKVVNMTLPDGMLHTTLQLTMWLESMRVLVLY